MALGQGEVGSTCAQTPALERRELSRLSSGVLLSETPVWGAVALSEGGMSVHRSVPWLLMTSSELDTALGGGKRAPYGP